MWRKFHYDETCSVYSLTCITRMMERNGVWVRHEFIQIFLRENLKTGNICKTSLQFGNNGHSITCLCKHRGEAKEQLQPIRSLGNRRGGGGVSTTRRPLYIQRKNRQPLQRRLRGPRSRSERQGRNRPHRDSIPRHSSPQQTAIPNTLPGRIGWCLILKWILKKQDGRWEIEFIWLVVEKIGSLL